MVQRFEKEVEVWSKLEHPNILPFYGLFWGIGDLPAMVAPWCSNGDIRNYAHLQEDHSDLDGLKLDLASHLRLCMCQSNCDLA